MEEEISLKDLINALFRKKAFIIVVTIISLILGIIYYYIDNKNEDNSSYISSDANTVYLASNLFTLGTKEKNVISEDLTNAYSVSDGIIEINENRINLFLQILKSKDTFKIIKDEFDIEMTYEDWSKSINLTQAEENTPVLSIEFEYINSDISINIVNRLTEMLGNKLIEVYSSYDIENPIVIIQETSILEKEKDKSITLQKKSESNNTIKYLAIPVIGFTIACIIIVFIECIDDSIKNKEQLEKSLKLKTLAVMPQDTKQLKEQIKILRINLSDCKKFLVTSVSESQKRDWASVNIAESFTKSGKKVLLIDLENENINLIKNYNKKGLSEYLESNDKFVEKYINETNSDKLNILTIGNNLENATELLESKKMIETMDILERIYDVVIISSGNILEKANTLAISKISKYAVLVIENRKDKLEDCIRAKKNVEDIGGTVIGTVLSL